MILNPQEEFVVARQLNDPADVSTNYVRAYIRNAKTDSLITTLDLEDKGSQRFTKTWQVVSDPTGLGLYITITTKVFTDSGYTVASTVYGVEQTELLIQDRLNPFISPVGPDIDYKRIRKIVVEELEKLPKPIEPKEPEKFDYEVLANGLQAVISEVMAIDLPKTDLRPVLGKLEGIQNKIEATKFPETDLSPVLTGLKDLQFAIKNLPQPEIPIASLEPLEKMLEEAVSKIMKHLEKMPVDEKKIKQHKDKASREVLKQYLNEH